MNFWDILPQMLLDPLSSSSFCLCSVLYYSFCSLFCLQCLLTAEILHFSQYLGRSSLPHFQCIQKMASIPYASTTNMYPCCHLERSLDQYIEVTVLVNIPWDPPFHFMLLISPNDQYYFIAWDQPPLITNFHIVRKLTNRTSFISKLIMYITNHNSLGTDPYGAQASKPQKQSYIFLLCFLLQKRF